MRYTGKVTEVTPTRAPRTATKRTVIIETEGKAPKAGDTVELRVTLTDEELGAKVRRELNPGESTEPYWRESITDLAEAVENAGWAGLADLIRDIGL